MRGHRAAGGSEIGLLGAIGSTSPQIDPEKSSRACVTCIKRKDECTLSFFLAVL